MNLSASPQLAILIDPDKFSIEKYTPVIEAARQGKFDLFLVGGSLTFRPIENVVKVLKQKVDLPIILFPGDVEQICYEADGILFLSLLSGRNPEYLIGKHVLVAKRLKDSGLQVVPTAYILVSSSGVTSVQYMTQTIPIPSDKPQLAVATAVAGELLGMRLVYLEAGSNATNPVEQEMIRAVKKELDIPLMVGGGISTPYQMSNAYTAGADIVVIGSAIEKNPDNIWDFVRVFGEMKKQKK